MSRFASPPSAGGMDGGPAGPAPRGDLLGHLPTLLDYLAVDRYDSGELRTVSTLLLFTDSGTWKTCLNDRESSRSLWASGRTPEEALEALETMLETGSGEWRHSAGPPKKNNGRRA